ncbi:MAG: hypothetical protein ACLPTM_14650 [Steroidobacteraceae bacterium]
MLTVRVLRQSGVTLAALTLTGLGFADSAPLIAQADAMPSWKPGDEFEAARRRALSERAAAGSRN